MSCGAHRHTHTHMAGWPDRQDEHTGTNDKKWKRWAGLNTKKKARTKGKNSGLIWINIENQVWVEQPSALV